MKKVPCALLGCLLLLGAGGGANAASYTIGYVNANKVFEESPQYEAARKALETEFTRRNNDLTAKQKQLKDQEEALARDQAMLSEGDLQSREREILSLRRKLKNAQDEFREDFNIRRNEEFKNLREQVLEVIREVGKTQDYDLILTDGVIYNSKAVDISDKVLQQLNEKFEASEGLRERGAAR